MFRDWRYFDESVLGVTVHGLWYGPAVSEGHWPSPHCYEVLELRWWDEIVEVRKANRSLQKGVGNTMKICATCTPEASSMVRGSAEATTPYWRWCSRRTTWNASNSIRDVPGVPAAAHDHLGMDQILSRGNVGLRRNLISGSVAQVRR